MSSPLLEIRGRFRRLAWSAKGEGHRFCIASIDLDNQQNDPKCPWCEGQPCECACKSQSVTVKGTADPNEFIQDLEYRFWGKWGKADKYGRQFEFKQLKRDEPHSRVAVVGYLRQFATGIGPVYASQLWDAFGADAVRVLRTDPARAAAAIGITASKAMSASEALNTDGQNEDLRLELVQLLDGRGFNKKLIETVIKLWGLAAPQRIRRDPFTLLINRLPSCGFARCDRLYQDLGLPLDRLKRQFVCIWKSLKDDGDGHTWHPIEVAEIAIRQGISGLGVDMTQLDWRKAVRLGVRAGWLRARKCEQGRWWIAEAKKANNEASVAGDMRRLMKVGGATYCEECCAAFDNGKRICSICGNLTKTVDDSGVSWPNPDLIQGLINHQREQLHIAFRGQLGILTGDPGTGKTTVTALVIKYLVETIGHYGICIAAPTNLAAMRIRSALEENQIRGISIGTFHRLLGVQRNGHDGSGWNFFYNRLNKMPYRVIFIDEDSMRDIDISASFLESVKDGTLILFLGDTNQLPPVGHGAPLRDGIAAGLPHGHFSEIIRNSGSITEFCEACRDGKRPIPPSFIDIDNDRNWRHFECSNPSGQKAILSSLLSSIGNFEIDGTKINPVRDSQIVIAVNEKGDLNRKDLNTLAQSILNPFGEQAEGNQFRVGDKIICTDNCKLKLFGDNSEIETDPDDVPEEFVSNGEIGFVRQVHKRFSVVELAEGRIVKVPVGKSDGDESNGSFDLAYAVTFHKSQGSEWKVVFLLSDRAANRMGSRELWNTGGSRPRKLLVTIGELAVIQRQCQRIALRDRKTFLKELICENSDRGEA